MKIVSNITGLCISLPDPKDIHSNGKDLVFVFKGCFPPFVLEEPYNFSVIFEKGKDIENVSQKNDIKRKPKTVSALRRSKET